MRTRNNISLGVQNWYFCNRFCWEAYKDLAPERNGHGDDPRKMLVRDACEVSQRQKSAILEREIVGEFYLFHLGDNGTSDDRPIRNLPDGAHMFRPGNAEANRHRKRGMAANARYRRGNRTGKVLLGPGHPRSGNDVDKAARAGSNSCHPCVTAGWSNEENGVQRVRLQACTVLIALFWSDIGHENSVDSGRVCIAGQCLKSILENGIEVAEQEQWYITGFAEWF